MKVLLTVNGAPREVEVEGGESGIAAVETGVYSVLRDGRSYEARIEERPGVLVVFIDGYRFEVQIRDPRRWSRQGGATGAEGRLEIAAPMPGKVVRLLTAEGEEVAAGQGLLVVEAMKMQNEMKAPKAGRVISLSARPGDTVAAGDILAAIE